MTSATETQLTDLLWKCNPCKKTFKSTGQLDEHKKSKNHKKTEKEYKVANPDVSETSMFQSMVNDSRNLTSSLVQKDDNDEEEGEGEL